MGNSANSLPKSSQSSQQPGSLPPYSLSESDDFIDEPLLLSTNQTPASPTSPHMLRQDLRVEMSCSSPLTLINLAKPLEIPCMLSLFSPDTEGRVGVDIVFIVEASGAMRGGKLGTIKEALRFIVAQLTDKDRVSLLSYNEYATFICPLTVCTASGKSAIHAGINLLSAKGEANMVSGLHTGLEVLMHRRQRNAITAICLLSGGRDKQPRADIRALEEIAIHNEMAYGPYAIHTFGLGTQHDAKALSAIASANGCYNYVKDNRDLIAAFGKCLGGLMSTFADSISMQLQPNCALSVPITIEKVYNFAENPQKVSNILTNCQKNLVFIINFPSSLQEVDSDTSISAISAIITYRLTAIGEQLGQEVSIPISLLIEAHSKVKINVDEPIFVNLYRVKTAEIMDKAGKFAESGDFQSGTELINSFLSEMQESLVCEREQIAVLRADLERLKSVMVSSDIWSQGGSALNQELFSNHMLQQGSNHIDIYLNRVQLGLKVADHRLN